MNKEKMMAKKIMKHRPQKSAAAKAGSNKRPPAKAITVTKKAQLISLLSKDAGSDISNISKKFGWLPHTTRAALSRLRRAGYEIFSIKAGAGQPSRYRITGAPDKSAQ